jgi:transposase-like protein
VGKGSAAAPAKAQWRQIADQIRPKVPKLAAMMDDAETDVLASMSFPKKHRTKLHSTKPIERSNTEIKRRTRVIGQHELRRLRRRSCSLPNEAAITRLVGAILMEQNDEWAVQRTRTMTLETIATVSDDTVTSQPSAAQ